jgi:ABC-type cobalt transport system substrate-binding protein
MRNQLSAVSHQQSAVTQVIVVLFLLFTFHFSLFTFVAFAEEKWQGIDESVVKKFAKEHGREAREPLINTDQGDLLLFVFLIAGTIGGFVAGYSWRKLTEGGARKKQKSKTDGTAV